MIHNSYIKTVVIVCRLEGNDLHVKTGRIYKTALLWR